MSGLAERSVTVNGAPCRVWEKGRGSPVFYLAGFGGLPRWTPFLDRLAGHHRVIAPSLPGFPGAAGHDRLDTLVDWVAAMSPALVRRLVLIAPFGLYDKKAPPADLWAQKPGTLPSLLCADPKTYTDHMAVPQGVSAEEWSIITTRASEAAARLLWPLADTRLERRLHRIRCATLIVWGAADKVLAPSYAERFATGITGMISTSIIPGAGHLADLDQPARVAEAVLTAIG